MKKIIMTLCVIAVVFLMVSNSTAVKNVETKTEKINNMINYPGSIETSDSIFDHFFLIAAIQFLLDGVTRLVEGALGRVSIVFRILRLIPSGGLINHILTQFCPSWVAFKDLMREIIFNPQ